MKSTGDKLQDQFIPFKESKILEKLGFDMDCFGYYENQDKKLIISYNSHPNIPEKHKHLPALYTSNNRNSNSPQWLIAAPTYQQAFEWFEIEHSMFITRRIDTTPNEILGFDYTIKSFRFAPKIVEFEKPYDEFDRNISRLTCLRKLISIIK